MRKQKKNKDKDQVLNMDFVSEVSKNFGILKEQWNLFKNNKEWIISLLFVTSIVHSLLLYGLFGINILGFYSLTDIFTGFAELLSPFIILLPLWLFFETLPNGKTKCSSILIMGVKLFVFGLFAIVISLVFDCYFGVLFIIYTVSSILILEKVNRKLLAWNFVFLLLLIAIVHPIENRLFFDYRYNTKLINRLSFEYMEKEYNLSDIDRYYYIGGSNDYFFVYDKSIESIEIIPISECRKITREPFYWSDLWKSSTYVNSTQKKHKRRYKRN